MLSKFCRDQGELAEIFKTFCDKVAAMNEKNPGHKSVLGPVCDQVKKICIRFQNELSALKVHIPKSGKSKKRKASPVDGRVKNELDGDPL